MSFVEIRVDDIDITADIFIENAMFESQVNGAVGTATFKVKDRDHTYGFTTGQSLTLDVDGVRTWGGYIMSVQKVYAFYVEDTTNEMKVTRLWEVTGADYNILFTRRYVFDENNPAKHISFAYKETAYDDTIIADFFDHYLDLSGDGLTRNGVQRIDHVLVDLGSSMEVSSAAFSWQEMMTAVSRISGGVYAISATKDLSYVDVETSNSVYTLTDQPRAVTDIGYQSFSILEDGTKLINDMLLWGLSGGRPIESFSRVQDDDSIDLHGRWQATATAGLFHQESMDYVANSYVYGTVQSHRGAKDNAVTFTARVFEPVFQAGQVVNVVCGIFDYEKALPLRKMTTTFPSPNDAIFDLELSHTVDPAFSYYDVVPIVPSKDTTQKQKAPPCPPADVAAMVPTEFAMTLSGFGTLYFTGPSGFGSLEALYWDGDWEYFITHFEGQGAGEADPYVWGYTYADAPWIQRRTEWVYRMNVGGATVRLTANDPDGSFPVVTLGASYFSGSEPDHYYDPAPGNTPLQLTVTQGYGTITVFEGDADLRLKGTAVVTGGHSTVGGMGKGSSSEVPLDPQGKLWWELVDLGNPNMGDFPDYFSENSMYSTNGWQMPTGTVILTGRGGAFDNPVTLSPGVHVLLLRAIGYDPDDRRVQLVSVSIQGTIGPNNNISLGGTRITPYFPTIEFGTPVIYDDWNRPDVSQFDYQFANDLGYLDSVRIDPTVWGNTWVIDLNSGNATAPYPGAAGISDGAGFITLPTASGGIPVYFKASLFNEGMPWRRPFQMRIRVKPQTAQAHTSGDDPADNPSFQFGIDETDSRAGLSIGQSVGFGGLGTIDGTHISLQVGTGGSGGGEGEPYTPGDGLTGTAYSGSLLSAEWHWIVWEHNPPAGYSQMKMYPADQPEPITWNIQVFLPPTHHDYYPGNDLSFSITGSYGAWQTPPSNTIMFDDLSFATPLTCVDGVTHGPTCELIDHPWGGMRFAVGKAFRDGSLRVWVNGILQYDFSSVYPAGGEFTMPSALDPEDRLYVCYDALGFKAE